MNRTSERLIGVSRARCGCCAQMAQLEIVESRRLRGLTGLLDRHFDAALFRTARCQSCGATYAIRAQDVTAGGAGRRVVSPGRDWRYPEVA